MSDTVYSYLYQLLSNAPSLSELGTNGILFGEEALNEQNRKPPEIVIVPIGGSISGPGTPPRGLDPETNMLWEAAEIMHIHCNAYDYSEGATRIDHYNATDILRQNVLKALQYQRYDADPDSPLINAGAGYWFKPTAGYWVMYDNAVIRYGRGYVIEVEVKILIIDDTSDGTETIDGIDISQMIIE